MSEALPLSLGIWWAVQQGVVHEETWCVQERQDRPQRIGRWPNQPLRGAAPFDACLGAALWEDRKPWRVGVPRVFKRTQSGLPTSAGIYQWTSPSKVLGESVPYLRQCLLCAEIALWLCFTKCGTSPEVLTDCPFCTCQVHKSVRHSPSTHCRDSFLMMFATKGPRSSWCLRRRVWSSLFVLLRVDVKHFAVKIQCGLSCAMSRSWAVMYFNAVPDFWCG